MVWTGVTLAPLSGENLRELAEEMGDKQDVCDPVSSWPVVSDLVSA